MGIGPGLYIYDVVVKSSRSLSNLLMSSCLTGEDMLKAADRKLLARWSICSAYTAVRVTWQITEK